MTSRLDGLEEILKGEHGIQTRMTKVESLWKSHNTEDERIHNGIREDLAQFAMDSTRQHGELSGTLKEFIQEAKKDRGQLYANLNDIREKVGEIRGELKVLARNTEVKES